MKLKIMSILLVLPAITFLLGLSSHLHADTVSLGINTLYAHWDPMFKEELSHSKDPETRDGKFEMTGPYAFHLGPILATTLSKRWSLSALFLVFQTEYKAESSYHEISSNQDITNTITLTRTDIDLTLNYSINSYLKFFFGGKRMVYSVSGKYISRNPSSGAIIDGGKISAESENMGPGAGFGLTLPLAEKYYLLWNLSGIYLRVTVTESSDEQRTSQYIAYGGNTTFSIAYMATPRIIYAIGPRYQYLKYSYQSGDRKHYDGQTDIFMGISFSVVYTFDVKGRN